MMQSDPIHGSLGPKEIKIEDLTAEQQYEVKLRGMKPVVNKIEKEMDDTIDSIKTAEEITGNKFPDMKKKD